MKEETKNKKVKKEHIEKEGKKVENIVSVTKEEIEMMNNKLKETEEKALRANAELINYRKRKDEEVERLLKYSNEDLVLELLPVLDNFERALKMSETDESAKNMMVGMKMVHDGLIAALEKYGVKEIEAEGKVFDPTYHQAVQTEEDNTKEKDVILEVYQKGYMLKDKLIRPAMVKVNK